MRAISKEIQPRLWAFIGGIAKTNGMVPIAIGGVEDHAHALIGSPAEMSVAKGVQLLKAGSSKIHEPEHQQDVGYIQSPCGLRAFVIRPDESLTYHATSLTIHFGSLVEATSLAS